MYYKRHWNDIKSDQFESWGTSIWYFEVDNDGYPTRQMEVYQNGNRLKYHLNKTFDDYGGLSDLPIDLSEFEYFKISKETFEKEWSKNSPKKEHREILDLISDYLSNHYDQRFGQALFNLSINEFVNNTNPSADNYRIRDIYGDSDQAIAKRIKNQINWFKSQKKEQ
jgi:hypothetical protein